ncbi:MAG: hypothetical protein FJX80_15500 [Bacteroidetes bacterium]|nr:hypothetical protein [Bacteroidota bacterium]
MGKFDKALIKQKSHSKVEKAFMNSKKFKLKDGFDAQATLYIPRAGANKPIPNLCMTISVGDDQLRVIATSPEELQEFCANLWQYAEESKEIATKVLAQERKQWMQHQTKLAESMGIDAMDAKELYGKIVSIKSA